MKLITGLRTWPLRGNNSAKIWWLSTCIKREEEEGRAFQAEGTACAKAKRKHGILEDLREAQCVWIWTQSDGGSGQDIDWRDGQGSSGYRHHYVGRYSGWQSQDIRFHSAQGFVLILMLLEESYHCMFLTRKKTLKYVIINSNSHLGKKHIKSPCVGQWRVPRWVLGVHTWHCKDWLQDGMQRPEQVTRESLTAALASLLCFSKDFTCMSTLDSCKTSVKWEECSSCGEIANDLPQHPQWQRETLNSYWLFLDKNGFPHRPQMSHLHSLFLSLSLWPP